MAAVTIPVFAKVRIGHFAEAQILQQIGVDMIDESEGIYTYESYLRGRLITTYGQTVLRRSQGSKFQLLQTTNHLIARPLSVSPSVHGIELRLF